ncbi:hypothetical protein DM785_16495 (plasmid) [Deinococcus actinosclerus]|nr:hypothetical protein DM785_16495 [Deinococcus actinosclerus]
MQAKLAAGEASLIVRVDCEKTSFRHIHETNGVDFDFAVPSESIRSRIELEALLVARADIREYSPAHVNPLYGENPVFSIQNGDLLAYAGAANLPVNLKFDPLTTPLGSIIRIRNVVGRSEIGLDLLPEGPDSEYVVILVPQEMWEVVSNHVAGPAIVANLVLPSMVEILNQMRRATDEKDNDLTGADWFVNLQTLLGHHQLDLDDDLLEIAQLLLTADRQGQKINPITRAFEASI